MRDSTTIIAALTVIVALGAVLDIPAEMLGASILILVVTIKARRRG